MVVLGVLLLGVTLKYPPYFGRGGTDESDTADENNSKRWYQRSGANRLRVAIDLAVLWTYICALVAVVAHTSSTSTSSDGTPSYATNLFCSLPYPRLHLFFTSARGSVYRRRASDHDDAHSIAYWRPSYYGWLPRLHAYREGQSCVGGQAHL